MNQRNLDMSTSTPNPIDLSCNANVVKTLNESDFLWQLLKFALVILIFLKTCNFAYFDLLGKFKSLTDFNAFYIAGKLALQGRLSEAYHFDQMHAAQIEYTGSDNFLPWTYPLPFDLILAPLALLPIAPAYLVFISISLVAYLAALKKLALENVRLLALLLIPALLLNIGCGQNGLLTGSLVGLFCVDYLRGKKLAGVPLGLMIIKPHLVAGIGLYLLLKREWRVLGVAAITALVLCLVASAFFGFSVWADFLSGVAESGAFLRKGEYPLFRMTSAFAAIFTLTGSFEWARLFQAFSILIALSILSWLFLNKTTTRNTLGLVCLLSAFYSPYMYDYDLPIVGLGLALLMPVLYKNLTTFEKSIASLTFLLAQGGWLLLTPLVFVENTAKAEAALSKVPSLAYFLLLLLTGLALGAINRSRTSRRDELCQAPSVR